jgi:diguanylate cyclase (GGDEF)-like protein
MRRILGPVGAIAILCAYVAVLSIPGTFQSGIALLVGGAAAVAIEGLRRAGLPDIAALVLAVAPLHLLVAATGGLASPAIPLAGAWVVALGLLRPGRAVIAAAVVGALLIFAGEWIAGTPLATPEALRLVVLLALAAGLPPLVRAHLDPGADRHDATQSTRLPAADSATAAERLLRAIHASTGTAEAALWEHDPESGMLVPLAWSSGEYGPAPQPLPFEDEHPYSWVLRDGQPVRLERGRKPLPRPFADEMLALAAGDRRVLALSFVGGVPNSAEAVAVACARIVAAVDLRPPAGEPAADEHDALTGLAGPGALASRLHELQGRTAAAPYSVILLDIDHFRETNVTWGHDAGDRMLQHVAMLLRGSLRDSDLAARNGGEEFAAVLPGTEPAAAAALAERLRETLQQRPLAWNGQRIPVSASFGVAGIPAEGAAPGTDLQGEAQTALLRAKRAGRNQVQLAGQRPLGSPGRAG